MIGGNTNIFIPLREVPCCKCCESYGNKYLNKDVFIII